MLNLLKKLYCFYIARLFLRSNSDDDLNHKLDKIIDKHMETAISGDNDLLVAITYTIAYRKYIRHLSAELPTIDNITIIKVIYKSLL